MLVVGLTLGLVACTSSGSAPTTALSSTPAATSSPDQATVVRLPEVLRGNPCPGSVELGFPSVPGAAQQLVPGSPGAAVECLLPTTHAVIRGEQLTRLIGDLNALPRHPGRLGVCPGTVTGVTIFFVYTSGDVQTVYIPSSCVGSSTTNGSFKAKMTAAVRQELHTDLHNFA